MTLDPTPAGTASNTYATESEATTYFALRSDSAAQTWRAELAPVREAALIEAAIQMEQNRYHRRRWSDANSATRQSLSFPREHHVDEQGNPVVEIGVKRAQSDQAAFIIETYRESAPSLLSSASIEQMRAMGLTSASVGSASLQFSETGGASSDPRVAKLIRAGFSARAAAILAAYVSSIGRVFQDAEEIVRASETRRLERFRGNLPVDRLTRDLIE